MADDIYPWSGNFNDLNADDQRAVAQLVVKGRAVVGTVDDLIARLKGTRCVALLRKEDGNRIVAAAACKRPGAAYRRDKFKAAGAPIAGFVNGGRIPGQRGGVKAGHFRRSTVVCKKAPDRGPFCKSASADGISCW